MKKTVLISILSLWVSSGFAQFDEKSLSWMNKIELSKIYIKEVQRVSKNLVLMAFDTVQHNVPENRFTKIRFRKVEAKNELFDKVLETQLTDIIPYADREKLIKSILYLQGL